MRKTAWNPRERATMTARTDPHTELHPFMHQAEGMVSGGSARSFEGKGMPMKRERGVRTSNPLTTLSERGNPRNEWMKRGRTKVTSAREERRGKKTFLPETREDI